jgi:hypothetical protein
VAATRTHRKPTSIDSINYSKRIHTEKTGKYCCFVGFLRSAASNWPLGRFKFQPSALCLRANAKMRINCFFKCFDGREARRCELMNLRSQRKFLAAACVHLIAIISIVLFCRTDAARPLCLLGLFLFDIGSAAGELYRNLMLIVLAECKHPFLFCFEVLLTISAFTPLFR